MPPKKIARIPEHFITERLACAARQCEERGAQLTELRREVLELLLRHGSPAKAYDLLEAMRAEHPRVAPTTVYRTLDFLVEAGLAHRIDALNAFVACNDATHRHHTVLTICARCHRTEEIRDEKIHRSLRHGLQATGFLADSIEIKGLCPACTGISNEDAQSAI